MRDFFDVYDYRDVVAVPIDEIAYMMAMVYLPKNLNKKPSLYVYNRELKKGDSYELHSAYNKRKKVFKRGTDYVITSKDNIRPTSAHFVLRKVREVKPSQLCYLNPTHAPFIKWSNKGILMRVDDLGYLITEMLDPDDFVLVRGR